MKIVIVDDSRAMRMLITHCLKEAGFKGHTLIEAANGKEALAVIDKEQPNLILSDWNMPQMSGIELLETLKARVEKNEMTAMIPFVFITSESTTEMLNKAKLSGALKLITKPFTPEVFEEELNGIIR